MGNQDYPDAGSPKFVLVETLAFRNKGDTWPTTKTHLCQSLAYKQERGDQNQKTAAYSSFPGWTKEAALSPAICGR